MSLALKFGSKIDNGSEGYSPYDFNQLRNYIADDKKQEFTQLLRSTLDEAMKGVNNSEIDLKNYLLIKCIDNRALSCAAALLRGDTGLTLDLNDPQLVTLHGAADALCPTMTKFFLRSGVRATAKLSIRDGQDGFTPIDFALHAIRRRVFWTRDELLYSLIDELIGDGMINPMQTMRLLIKDLSESEASEVVCRCAAEAKIVELATLLILCSERAIIVGNLYMPSNYVSLWERMSLRQYVVNQIVLLENKACELVEVDSTKLAECRKLKEAMTSILMLLEIFQRTDIMISRMAMSYDRQSHCTHGSIAKVLGWVGLQLICEDTSSAGVPLVESMCTESRRQESLDDFLSRINSYFKSGVPQLDSFEAMPDFGWDDTDPNYQKLLPLRVALDTFSSVVQDKDWISNLSMFKLIIILCLPRMKEPLDVARLFAQKSKKINEIACCYAKEGKLIELAIILMAAGPKVMDPIKYKIKGGKQMRFINFQQFVNSELAQVVDLECRLIGRTTEQEKELSNLCKQRKFAMMSALKLIEIFKKAGPNLRNYICKAKKVQKDDVIRDVSKLLSEAGFKLKCKDTKISDSVDSSIKAAFRRWEETVGDLNKRSGILQDLNEVTEMPKRSGFQSQNFGRLSYVLPCGFVETQAAYGRPDSMRKFLFARYPRECMVLPSSALSFRAFWTSKDRSSYSTGSPKAVEVQQGDVSGVSQTVQKFPVSKKFASVASAIKRRVKYA